MLDVRLRVLRDAAKDLRHRQRVRFHLGASEVLGRVVLLEGESLAPGKDGLAQIRLESPVVADRGDRFVLRSYSPARAVAGGKVILPAPPKRRRGHRTALEELRREESGSVEDRLLAALDGMPLGGAAHEIFREAGLSPSSAQPGLEALLAQGRAVAIGDDQLVSAAALSALQRKAVGILGQLQRDYPLRWGTSRGELKSRLGVKLTTAVFDRVVADLARSGEVSTRDDHVRLGGEAMELPADVQAKVEQVAEMLDRGGGTPPMAREIESQLGEPVHEILEHLTFGGEAAKVSPDLYLHRSQLRRILDWLEGYFQEHDDLNVSDLREGLGMSRKYSVPILEYLDKQGWTRRIGDVRRPGRRWQTP
jgi:selenocysteine-specific elongation factor